MEYRSKILISFSVSNAFKTKAKLNRNDLSYIDIDYPIARNTFAWVTKQEEAYFNIASQSEAGFWDEEYDELNFTLIDKDEFDHWPATL